MLHQKTRWEQERSFHSFVDGKCTNCGITEKWLHQLIYPEDPWELNALPYCVNTARFIEYMEEEIEARNRVDLPNEDEW